MKVLDLTEYVNGPGATMMLADNGADVLKVEPPEGGGLRLIDQPNGPTRLGFAMESYNRGKRSIILNLKHPRAKDVMERLVRWAVTWF